MSESASPIQPGEGHCWNHIGVFGDGSCPELAEHIHCRNCPVFKNAASRFFDRPAPKDYLSEWSQLLAEPVDDIENETACSVLIFRVGSEWFGLDINAVSEVTQQRSIHRVPHRTNNVMLGLANVRGQLELCVSLAGLFELTPADDEDETLARFVVARRSSETWVLPVDEVHGIVDIEPHQLGDVPVTVTKGTTGYVEATLTPSDVRDRTARTPTLTLRGHRSQQGHDAETVAEVARRTRGWRDQIAALLKADELFNALDRNLT